MQQYSPLRQKGLKSTSMTKMDYRSNQTPKMYEEKDDSEYPPLTASKITHVSIVSYPSRT
jgi:hypothetical protein